MHETTALRHGLEDTSIRNLVPEEESNVLITHQPFTSKLLAKGIHLDSTIEDSIQAVFGVLPEQGRVIPGSPWSAISWGTNEYLMTNTNTSSVPEFLDVNQPLEENSIKLCCGHKFNYDSIFSFWWDFYDTHLFCRASKNLRSFKIINKNKRLIN